MDVEIILYNRIINVDALTFYWC